MLHIVSSLGCRLPNRPGSLYSVCRVFQTVTISLPSACLAYCICLINGVWCHLSPAPGWKMENLNISVCVCVQPLTQQEDFNLLPLLLLLLLEDPLDLLVHGDAPLLLLGQAAHAGAVAPHPAPRHGRENSCGGKQLMNNRL